MLRPITPTLRIAYRCISNPWSRRFGPVVERWTFNPAARVQISPESLGFFFGLICYALFFVTAFVQ